MDKVIINGVDVSECDFLLMRDDNPKCECCHATGFGVICDCEMWKTCYYKQLQRLQAKYDDLHLNYAECKTANTGLQELNQKLQAENERLKEENKELKSSLVSQASIIFTLEKSSNDLSQGINKLYKVLKEIKEIIKDCDNGKCFTCKYNKEDAENCIDNKHNEIIDKINEVIGAE
jgi:predicted nuclease with TOPRIM domain